jgi:hypothetical protein
MAAKEKPDRFYCGDGEEHEHPIPRASMSGRIFRYQMVYGNYPAYAFSGMNNAQTVAVIRAAMAELSTVSGAKFSESSRSPHVRFYFTKVPYNAIAAYMGKGKIYLSQTRKITTAIAKICVQHEVGHYLGIKAKPASDKWGHCPDKTCVMNINGTGPKWCSKCRAIMTSKYGNP